MSVIYTQKTVDFGIIPPKLFKMTESVLFQPLSDEINNSLSKDHFPDDAEIPLVSPLDKGTSKKMKNDISSFRQVSNLTTFSKIHENLAKKN